MADIAAVLSERARDIVARAGIAGCVAVALFAITASLSWIFTGTSQLALGQAAFAVPFVFTVTAVVRTLGGLFFRDPPDPVKVVTTDVGLGMAGLVFIASVGTLANSGGSALYAVLVAALFFMPAVLVASVIIEIVLRNVWLVRTAIALAAVSGTLVLVVYAVQLSGR